MGATKDFIKQSAAPTSVSPSNVVLYANTNGVLMSLASGAAPIQLGTVYTGSYTNNQVQTGTATYISTGVWFGQAAGATLQTGLATPAVWVPIVLNGVNYAIPGYKLQ